MSYRDFTLTQVLQTFELRDRFYLDRIDRVLGCFHEAFDELLVEPHHNTLLS